MDGVHAALEWLGEKGGQIVEVFTRERSPPLHIAVPLPAPRKVAFTLTDAHVRAVNMACNVVFTAGVLIVLYAQYSYFSSLGAEEEKGGGGGGSEESALKLTPMERGIYRACRVKLPAEASGDAFAGVGGLEEAVARLREQAVLPLSSPRLLAHSRLLQAPSGVLLFGPPGTGKTLLASRLAQSTSATFLSLNPATLQNMYVGQSVRLTAAAFSLARKCAPCIMFFDEADGLLPRRDGGGNISHHSTEFITNFLSCWEGLGAQEGGAAEGKWVLVVAASNRPWAMDAAALRRLPCQLEVPMPSAGARASILRALLAGERCEAALLEEGGDSRVAALTEHFSGSDLRELVKTAALAPVREAIGAGKGASVRPLGLVDLLKALDSVRPSGVKAAQYLAASRGSMEPVD